MHALALDGLEMTVISLVIYPQSSHCLLHGTNNVRGQIFDDISAQNRGYCLHVQHTLVE